MKRTKFPSLCGFCCLYRFDLERKRLSLEKKIYVSATGYSLIDAKLCHPGFQSGERVFKPARTLYLAMRALQAAEKLMFCIRARL
jgi:hypothetical protein